MPPLYEYFCLPKDTNKHANSRTICKSFKLETTHTSINNKIDKYYYILYIKYMNKDLLYNIGDYTQ